MGNKILRQRLRGPSLAKYYPPRGPDINTLARDFKKYNLEVINEPEDDRLEHLAGQALLLLPHRAAAFLGWRPADRITG